MKECIWVIRMKIGKLPEAVEQRSVVKLIRAKGKEPASVVTVGQETTPTGKRRMAAGEIVVEYMVQVDFLADRVAGLLAAEAAKAEMAVFVVTLPATAEEKELKQLVRACQAAAERLDIGDYTVQTRCSSVVIKPVVAVTMTGEAESVETPGSYIGSAIVMAGYAAMEATVCMMEAEKERLEARLSGQFLNAGKELLSQTDTRMASAIALEHGALVKTAGEGGIFTALWELGSYLDCGMQVELRNLLLRQETIEVCEVLDLNPYLMFSGGAILAVTEKPEELLAAYQNAGIPAAVAGVLTKGHDRILQNGEEQRFLEPFREDELHRTGILH